MPDYTVKADVDTMLRANDKAGIRSAIGVGTTDVPIVAGIAGATGGGFAPVLQTTTTSVFHSSISGFTAQRHFTFGYQGAGTGGQGASTTSTGAYAWTSSGTDSDTTRTLLLFQDAAGILAQRNGVNKQVHRVYNTFLGTTANEWGGFDWLTTTNTLRIGTEHGGTGVGRTIHFVIGGIPTWVITTSGHLQANTDNAYDIGASGTNRPRNIYAAGVFNFGLINGALPGGTIYGGHIGTSQYFAIKGTSTVASTIYIQNGSSGDKTGWVRVLGSGSVDHGALEVGALGSSPVIFTTALTERMRLSAAGNLGIGTTSPTSKLQVSDGDIEVDTIAKGVILKSPDGTRYRVTVPNGGAVLTITAV